MKESVTSGLWAGSVMPRLLTRVVESGGHVIKPALHVTHARLPSPEKSTRRNDGWQTAGSSISLSHASLSISDLLALQCIILPFSSFILSFPLSPLPGRHTPSLPPPPSRPLLIVLPQAPAPSFPLSHYLSCSFICSLFPQLQLKDYCMNPSDMAFCLFNGTTAALPSPSSTPFVHIFSTVKHQRFEMN